MSIIISSVTCNKWRQELATTHETLHSVCEQMKYSQELLKRARHEINKRGAKINRLRKEVKELEGAVQHLAKENVHLTEQLRGVGVVSPTE